MKSLLVVYSYHHKNTWRVAEAMAREIKADLKSPLDMSDTALNEYDLIGFGAGIDSGSHYRELLDYADRLPPVDGNLCFIFSTSAVQGDKKVRNDHAKLRKLLQAKGYQVIDEFSCKGYNTNSFLKYIGGMNRGCPCDADLHQAKQFVAKLAAKYDVRFAQT